MKSFFPEIKTYKTQRLRVSDIHELHIEEAGNPNGKPILFLHGGPGASLSDYHRRFFDPQFYRIILFDQRGCGKSTPHAELRENTTWDLVRDIEKIRALMGVEKWVVFGGSWGSTLALAYAQTHPDKVLGLILRGIFLCRREEIRWFYQFGAHHLFPDRWETYVAPIPVGERENMVEAFYKRLTSTDEKVQIEAAKAWSGWEGSTLKLIPDTDTISDFEADKKALSVARIECHYFMHDAFFAPDDQLLRDAHKIKNIPIFIAHGRYDVVCPVKNAWELKRALPQAELEIIPDSGHAADESGTIDALIRATESFKRYYR